MGIIRRRHSRPRPQSEGDGFPMTIIVEAGDWQAPPQDVQRLCEDVQSQFLRHLDDPPTGRILLRFDPMEGPRVLFRVTPEVGDYTVLLSARGTKWARHAYEFAHELCHIVCRYERLRGNPNRWIEESLCELASISFILQMSETWKSAAPYPNWISFASSLESYGFELVHRSTYQLLDGETLGSWLRSHEHSLRMNPCQRDLNGQVALQLLPLFRSDPRAWRAIQHLPSSHEYFEDYLATWERACPPDVRGTVRQIAEWFSTVGLLPAPYYDESVLVIDNSPPPQNWHV